MTTLREAATQALEAMLNFPDDISDEMFESITALKAALEQQEPVQEPVAWRFEARHIDSAWGAAVSLKHPGPEGVYMRNVVPLYTAPPQRKPLTEEEIEKAYREIWRGLPSDFDHTSAGWIEMSIKYAERAHGIT